MSGALSWRATRRGIAARAATRAGTAVLLGLAALVATAGAATPEPTDPAVSWLDRQLEDAGDGTLPVERARAIVEGLRRRLVDNGTDRNVADALLPEIAGAAAGDVVLRELRATRRRLLDFAEAARRVPPAVPPGARGALREILEDPVFRTSAEPGLLQVQLNRLRTWIGRVVGRVLGAVLGQSSAMSWLAAGISVAALVFLAMRFVAPLLGRRRSGDEGPAPAPARARATRAQDPRELLEAARRAIEAGRAVEAIKTLERAAILALQRRRLLPARAGLTDLEGVAWLRAHEVPGVGADFARLADLHDRLVYAGQRATADALATAVRLAGRIVGDSVEQPA